MLEAEFLESLMPQAAPLKGARVLLYGFSGAGFPGGDGATEAVNVLTMLGVDIVRTHELDEGLEATLAREFDIAIICNTRVQALACAPARLWACASRRVLWFWDLRPGAVAAPLTGRIDHVFLSFDGTWTAPDGTAYAPQQWAKQLGCPVGYCPQGSPLRKPKREPEPARIIFIGDTKNATYHRGRAELCTVLDVTVLNERDRGERHALERRMPMLYRSSRYCLSTSPPAPGYTSVRTYSILACGGLLLLQRFPGCESFVTDGEHAVVFDSPHELRARLAQLDDKESERERIAASGRSLHARNYTVAHRVVAMCREVLGIAQGAAA